MIRLPHLPRSPSHHQLDGNTLLAILWHPPTGRIIWTRRQRLRSYVLAYRDVLAVQLGQAPLSIPDITNTPRTLGVNTNNLSVNQGAGSSSFGPVIGTSAQAVTLADYKLVAQITHGVGAGQMQHGATAFIAPFTTGNTRRYQITRVYTNNSGSDITVREAALYAMGGATPWFFCLVRDVLGSPVTVSHTQALTLQYQLDTTV